MELRGRDGGLWVKVCGLRTRGDVDAAVAAGADAVGFVFAAGSPRLIAPDEARPLAASVPDGVAAVGVFRDQDADEVVAIAEAAGIRVVQLHGDEGPDVHDRVRAHGLATIRAVSAERYLAESPGRRAAFEPSGLLLDAATPGAGVPTDADISTENAPRRDWVLAGGLSPENVGAYVERLAPTGVDVSSGVESSRGVKSAELIHAFVAAARAAHQL